MTRARTLLAGSLFVVGGVLTMSSATQADVEADTGFGVGGVVTVDLLDEVSGMTVDSMGRTVVVGLKLDSATFGHVAIARYLPNGQPDTSFSDDGRADLSAGARYVSAEVRVLADGSIVIAGERGDMAGDPFSWDLFLAKVSDSGVPDTGVGPDGVASSPEEEFGNHGPGAVAIGPDGSAIVGVSYNFGGQLFHFTAGGVVSMLDTTEDVAVLGAGCVAQVRQVVDVLFLSPSDIVFTMEIYGGDIDGAGPLTCSYREEALLAVRQTVTGNAGWTRGIPNASSEGPPVLVGTDIVFRADEKATENDAMGSSVTASQHVHRLSGSGEPVASWGTAGRVTLRSAAPFLDPSEHMVALVGGGFAMVNVNDKFSSTEPAVVTVSLLTATGMEDTSFIPVVFQRPNGFAETELAATPDGGFVVATTFTDEALAAEATELRRFTAITTDSGPDIETLTPARLLDTRPGAVTADGVSAGGPRPVAGSVTKVRVAGRGGVPADALAAIVNLTVVLPDGPGFATLYPCTPTPPNASNINFLAGAFVANSVTAKLDANGDVCIFTLTGADLLIDVNGFVPAGSDVGTLTPARLLDTRVGAVTADGVSAGGPRPVAGSVTKVRVAGRGGVPADATAAIVNLTVVLPDGPGFATLYPCTPTPPNASNINFLAGSFVANSVTAKLDANGDVCIFTLTGADLLIDVNAFVGSGASVGTLTPARLLDTRAGAVTVDGVSAGGPRPVAGSVTTVRVAGRGGVPANATTAIVNLTVVLPDGPGFATLYPCTPTPPNASNINFLAGAFVANSVAAKLDPNGDVCIFTLTGADLLIDVSAYVAPSA